MKCIGIRLFVVLFTSCCWSCASFAEDTILSDDFENGLGQWEFFTAKTMEPCSDEAMLVDSEDPDHGKVLALMPGQLIGLIKGSENWNNYQLEGDVCFPTTPASLMGIVYNLNRVTRPNWNNEESELRTEFGSIYIKCGGSYIRVNPHYDGTAGRALYDDYKTPLTGNAAIRLNEWKHFKYEVFGDACHLYVDDMETPKVTFYGYHHSSGRVGFRPRSAGGECWVDSVRARSIDALSFKEQIIPAGVTWESAKLITDWYAIGPFHSRVEEIEEAEDFQDPSYPVEGHEYHWVPFPVDYRGCVISGKICDFSAPGRKLAYFRTSIRSDTKARSLLKFSTRSDLTVFVNGKMAGKVAGTQHIWPDFWKVERHESLEVEISLQRGINNVTLLVDGGQYPGCGFYALIEDAATAAK